MISINYLKEKYLQLKNQIHHRLDTFKEIWKSNSSNLLFEELVFCLLTPQSKAIMADKAITALKKQKLLFSGDFESISEILKIVRFRNNKARYILRAQEKFIHNHDKIDLYLTLKSYKSSQDKRTWLVQEITGIGLKEASHYLRNIGLGENIAILDRHILAYLLHFGIIKEIPKTLSLKKYLQIEQSMTEFSKSISIPIDELDLLLWYLKTGFFFK